MMEIEFLQWRYWSKFNCYVLWHKFLCLGKFGSKSV